MDDLSHMTSLLLVREIAVLVPVYKFSRLSVLTSAAPDRSQFTCLVHSWTESDSVLTFAFPELVCTINFLLELDFTLETHSNVKNVHV